MHLLYCQHNCTRSALSFQYFRSTATKTVSTTLKSSKCNCINKQTTFTLVKHSLWEKPHITWTLSITFLVSNTLLFDCNCLTFMLIALQLIWCDVSFSFSVYAHHCNVFFFFSDFICIFNQDFWCVSNLFRYGTDIDHVNVGKFNQYNLKRVKLFKTFQTVANPSISANFHGLYQSFASSIEFLEQNPIIRWFMEA